VPVKNQKNQKFDENPENSVHKYSKVNVDLPESFLFDRNATEREAGYLRAVSCNDISKAKIGFPRTSCRDTDKSSRSRVRIEPEIEKEKF
jgi:hypothetical protein